jgi:hypothetical protein
MLNTGCFQGNICIYKTCLEIENVNVWGDKISQNAIVKHATTIKANLNATFLGLMTCIFFQGSDIFLRKTCGFQKQKPEDFQEQKATDFYPTGF